MEDVRGLNLRQLSERREQIRKDVGENQARYQSMATALGRYQDSLRSIEMIEKSKEGDKLLVPITGSLFVPGGMANTTHVTVEIGTGFFVKKSTAEARDFCERKIKTLKEFTDRVGESILAMTNNLRQLEQLMQIRVQELKAQEEQA